MSGMNDAMLVARTRGGDRAAYGELVARYQGHVYGMAYSMVGNWADAQDIAQETFIRAYCNLDQLREPHRFPAWLRRVAFGVTVNWLKAFRPRLYEELGSPEDLERLEVPDFAPGPAEVTEKRELAAAVLKAVAALPPKYRVPLTMFHLDGLSYENVAGFLDIPIGTAKSLISRARQKLKPALSAYAGEELHAMVKEVFEEHKLPAEFARKVLEAVPTLGWGRDRECTFIGALEAALAVTPHPYPYSDLMGCSGMAFRVRWQHRNRPEDGWCPSCTVGEFPEETEAVSRATGWQFRHVTHFDDPAPDMARYAPEIVAAIDAGRPVVGYPDHWNVAVVHGYEDGGKAFLWRDYVKPGPSTRLPADQTGRWLMFLEAHTGPPAEREAVAEALRLAVRHWRRGRGPGPQDSYLYGDAAYAQWIADLGATAGFLEEQRGAVFFLGWWSFSTLLDARLAATAFLRDHLGALGEEARRELQRALDTYEREVALLQRPFREGGAFLGAWSGKSLEHWTPEVREREQQVLREARGLEAEAVTHLEAALQAAEA